MGYALHSESAWAEKEWVMGYGGKHWLWKTITTKFLKGYTKVREGLALGDGITLSLPKFSYEFPVSEAPGAFDTLKPQSQVRDKM